jgi:hypothetical protein
MLKHHHPNHFSDFLGGLQQFLLLCRWQVFAFISRLYLVANLLQFSICVGKFAKKMSRIASFSPSLGKGCAFRARGASNLAG